MLPLAILGEHMENEKEENAVDRKLKYRKLVAGGMSDRDASEEVWPTTAAGMLRNRKILQDKADLKASKEAK
jgi:hypothetical protein